jgi:hypothetical protein
MKIYEEYYMEFYIEFRDSLVNKNEQNSNNEPITGDKESIIRKESHPKWAFVLFLLFTILIPVNAIFFGSFLFGLAVDGLPSGGGALGIIGAFILAFPLAIIDFIAVLLFMIIQKPQGIVKFISYTALTIVGLMLFYASIAAIDIYF